MTACASEIDVFGGGSGGSGGNAQGGQGGSAGQGAAGGGAQGGSAGAGTGGGGGGCVNPQPILVDGSDTGFDLCAGGQYRRREVLACPTSYPDDPMNCCGGCPEGQVCSDQGEIACTCVEGCTRDAECADGELCFCGDPAGICVQAACNSGADCAPGEECTSWDYTQGCLYYEFACTTPADTCGGDLDCTDTSSYCTVVADGHRECVVGGCSIGRPFLIGDGVRTAASCARGDWLEGALAPARDHLDEALARELARAWEQVARMEHASIAAFARFTLQLLALGAPADLIERSASAMADETRHARAAYALASAYGGAELGPAALDVDGALEGALDLAAIVRLTIREGCVGETVAAVEAAEAASAATDPVVCGVLGVVAADESAHAELAWRFIHWALHASASHQRAAARRALKDELARIEADARDVPGATPTDERLLSHGVVSDALRAKIRQEVLSRAVLPCLRALAASAPAERAMTASA